MAEKATILIPDISGFTEFTGTTEIDHAAHIINELLELIVSSNSMGFTLAEIEGDAVLFYLKEDASSPEKIAEQCLEMFRNFHSRLMVIERDTVCQCGACQTASNLTLKFIVHFGEIKEIRVAQFVKATGIDMIVAHRLLKNSIDSNEYILISQRCLGDNASPAHVQGLKWTAARENYTAIGDVAFHYSTLSDIKSQIPQPAKPPEFVIVKGSDNLELEVENSILNVYQALINVDARKDWMLGVDKINRDSITERIGMKHNCVFMGMTMINTCLDHEFSEDSATYVERVEVPEMSLDTVDIYDLTTRANGVTHLNFNINWKDTPLPDDMKQGMLQGIKANLESFKNYVER